MPFRPEKIISGGQTGVDRGALDAALNVEIESGGWCPAGRLAEDGCIPERYQVRELGTGRYEDRTELNVADSDATLIIARSELSGGTLYTKEMACRHNRPSLVINPEVSGSEQRTAAWMSEFRPKVLNIAGPRESKDPGIQKIAEAWLIRIFSRSND